MVLSELAKVLSELAKALPEAPPTGPERLSAQEDFAAGGLSSDCANCGASGGFMGLSAPPPTTPGSTSALTTSIHNQSGCIWHAVPSRGGGRVLVLALVAGHYLVLAEAGCAQSFIHPGLDRLERFAQFLDPTKAPHEDGEAVKYGKVRKPKDEVEIAGIDVRLRYGAENYAHARPNKGRQKYCPGDLGQVGGDRQRCSQEAGPARTASVPQRHAEGGGREGKRREGGLSRTVLEKLAMERPFGDRHAS